jgi:uncharacterized membrane protein YgcG
MDLVHARQVPLQTCFWKVSYVLQLCPLHILKVPLPFLLYFLFTHFPQFQWKATSTLGPLTLSHSILGGGGGGGGAGGGGGGGGGPGGRNEPSLVCTYE